MLRKVDRILIRVPQIEGAVHYYRDAMGLTVVREDAHIAVLRFPEGSIELVLHSDSELPAEGIYFLVDDVREMYDRRDELKLTFIAAPSETSRGFRAIVKDPFGTVLQLVDHKRDPKEPQAPAGMLFEGAEPRVEPRRKLLVELYEKVGRTADDLPYTPHFEELYEPYAQAHPDPKPSRSEVWRHLLNLRKSKQLPKLGEAPTKPPPLPPDAILRLKTLLADDLGKRDRLPYTNRFDELVDQFNQTLQRPLSPHLIWRAVATLAK